MSRMEEKIDVLDLIISILKDHEASMSELIGNLQIVLERLERFSDVLEKVMEKVEVDSET